MVHDLAIVGAGGMAEAIARGILSAKVLQPGQIIAADISDERRRFFQSQLRIESVAEISDAVRDARIVLLCVKPYQMQTVLPEIGSVIGQGTLVISIAAGISSAFIEKHLSAKEPLKTSGEKDSDSRNPGAKDATEDRAKDRTESSVKNPPAKNWRVIRAMPNTPMLVGAGMVAIAAGQHAGSADLAAANQLFSAAATVIETTEDKMDAVTAVSGSGPAYFFFLVEQMIRAGVEMGLTPEESRTLAITTAVGAAKMMRDSHESPAEHRKRVTTPNGTTHAAITHMEQNHWPTITIEALKAAARRSREMGK
jgi:pyrroline-5-carboxylate reductase